MAVQTQIHQGLVLLRQKFCVSRASHKRVYARLRRAMARPGTQEPKLATPQSIAPRSQLSLRLRLRFGRDTQGL